MTARDADGNQVRDAFEIAVVAAPEPEQTGMPDVVARYDGNDNGVIDVSEYIQARRDHVYGKISDAEWQLVLDAWLASGNV